MSVTQTLPTEVINKMAQHRTRFHRYLWHRLRNSWLSLTEGERNAVRAAAPEWEPPRPALDALRSPLRNNGSGEDFLFMHRQMLECVNVMLSLLGEAIGGDRVRGWHRLPPPGDTEYPVPEFPDSGLEEFKSPEYYESFLAPLERRFTDADYLRGVTLGQLGSDIEFTVHVGAHVRWAAPSAVGYRPTYSGEGGIEAPWDEPAYDYLGDTYSSHVNPVFWKLHGWINNRVEDWRRAHGIEGVIVWEHTWVGPPVDLEHNRQDELVLLEEERWRRIDRIISASGTSAFDGFFRPQTRLPLARARPPLPASSPG